MGCMNFVLPMTRDDLLECNSPDDRYSVATVYKENELVKKLQDAKRALDNDENGPYGIFYHFDVLYSALFHFGQIDEHVRQKSWRLLVGACAAFKEHLVKVFKSNEIDEEVRSQSLNAIKMLLYLLTQYIVNFETYLDKKNSKEEKKLSKVKGGNAKKKQSGPRLTSVNKAALTFEWEDESMDAVILIHHMMLLPIQKLWSTPLVEEQFVNMIGNCCYKILDDPDINLVKMKAMRDSVFDILGILIKNHCHAPTFIITVVKLLTSTDHLTGVLAKGIVTVVNKHHQQGLVRSLVSEILHHGVTEFSKESGAAKAYSEFLMNLAEGDPAMMMSSINILLPQLGKDPYQLRNCVLSVLAEVLVQDLNAGNLEDEERKDFREEIYENLEEHLHDTHAFVRSKVVQIWLRLFEVEAVPMERHFQLLESVCGRLQDKAANVRKFALQLVIAFLEKHAYVAKFGVEMVRGQLRDEKAKLHTMEAVTKPLKLDDEQAAVWAEMEQPLTDFLTAKLQAPGGEPDVGQTTLDAVAITTCVEMCRTQLQRGNFKEAFTALCLCEAQEESQNSTIGLPLAERLQLYKLIMARVLFNLIELPSAGPVPSTESQDAPPASQITADTDASLVNPFTCVNVAEKDVAKAKQLVMFFYASYKVGKQINSTIPFVRTLLSSPTTTDVLEAINFFTAAQPHKFEDVDSGVQEMLNLIWSPEEAIRNTVAEAYRTIYLASNNRSKSDAVNSVDNLTKLVQCRTLTIRQKAGLDKLVVKWIEKDAIDRSCLLLLWDRYNMTAETSDEDSLGAAILLAMIAKCQRQVPMIRNNVDNLVKVGFGPRGQKDYRLVLYTCQTLSGLAPAKQTSDSRFVRLRKDQPMFTSLCNILVQGLTNMDSNQYIPMATEAINLIFKVSEFPDQVCEALLKDLLNVLRKEHEAVPKKNTSGNTVTAGEATEVDSMELRRRALPIVLARLIHCVGHVGLALFHYIDKDVYIDIKRRVAETEMETNRKKEEEKAKEQKERRKSASHIVRQSMAAPNASDEEDDLEGAVAEDEDAEMIKSLCDKQLLSPTNLLGVLSRLIEYVVTHTDIYQNVNLQASATLALGKLMALSSSFCGKKLECLIAFAMQSPHPVIRSNAVLIIRDLTFRFPTMLEPETKHLYMRLRDESRDVRANAMTALSSLILTEMVKAKSNISQLSRCIVDEDQDMVQRAKELFKMMSMKGNQLYNALPDIISKLSNPEEKVEEEDFHTIMKYIMSLIQKDRQHELLVEKLCARFRLSESERQWRDLAFCLSLLVYNERSARKLLDNMPLYADKLQHNPVYNYFQGIAEQGAKQPKPEIKVLLDELEQRLELCRNKEMDDESYAQKCAQRLSSNGKTAPKSTKKAAKNQANAKRKTVAGKKNTRNARPAQSSESEEESESNNSSEEETRAKPTKTPKKTAKPSKLPTRTPAKLPSRTPAKLPSRTPAKRRATRAAKPDTTSEDSSSDQD